MLRRLLCKDRLVERTDLREGLLDIPSLLDKPLRIDGLCCLTANVSLDSEKNSCDDPSVGKASSKGKLSESLLKSAEGSKSKISAPNASRQESVFPKPRRGELLLRCNDPLKFLRLLTLAREGRPSELVRCGPALVLVLATREPDPSLRGKRCRLWELLLVASIIVGQ